jgi:hypothetical protein
MEQLLTNEQVNRIKGMHWSKLDHELSALDCEDVGGWAMPRSNSQLLVGGNLGKWLNPDENRLALLTVLDILRLPLAGDTSRLESVDLLIIDGAQPFSGGELGAAVSALVAQQLCALLRSRCSHELNNILVADADSAAVRGFLGDELFGGYRVIEFKGKAK